MIEFLSLMYDLYNYYIFMFVFFICAIISYNRKKHTLFNGTIEKAVLLFGIFMIGLGCSVIVWWIPTSLFGEPFRVFVGMILVTLVGWSSPKIVNWVMLTAKKICSKEHIKRWGYGLTIFSLWMLQFIIQLPDCIAEWVECWHAVDYSMGIGSRFFVGSVISLFYDGYMDVRVAYAFCTTVIILLIAVCSYMLGKLMNRTKHKAAVAFMIACFWACPASLSAYWTPENIGRLEFYSLFVALISVCLFLKCKRKWMKYGILCLGAIVCNAIYQGYVFLYFPLIFIVIVCEAYKTGFKKEEVIGAILVLVSVCVSFLFFQFGSSIVFETQKEFEEAIRERSNVYICSQAIRYELFMSIPEVFGEVNIPFTFGDRHPREVTAITAAIFSPIVVMGIALYLKCFDNFKEKSKNLFKNPYFLCILCQLAVLPQFLLNIDWGRWIIAIVIVFFFGIFYMHYIGMEEMDIAIASLSNFLKKHYFIAAAVVLYLALFAKLTDQGMRTQIVFIIKNLARLLGLV